MVKGLYVDCKKLYTNPIIVRTYLYGYNRKNSMAVLKIYGDIGQADEFDLMFGGGEIISAKTVSDFLDENQDADEITVKINSRGGDVQEGWAIYDLLKTSGKKITTIGEGKVYSIATIIFLSGTTRKMLKNADGLIHMPFIPPYTLADQYESDDLLKIAEGLKQEEAKILDFYVEMTGGDKATLEQYMKEETKLSAEDMVKLGFATEVVEPVVAYAFINPHKKFKMTDKDRNAWVEKLKALMESPVAKALGFSRLTDPQNIEMTDKAGNKFKLDKESGEPAVGDTASPDGSYEMESGETIVIAGGKITEIKPKAEPPANKEVETLQAQVNALTAERDTLTAKVAEMETAQNAFNAQKTQVENLFKELTGLKNQWKPETRGAKTGSTDGGTGINLDRVQEILNLQKK